MGLIMNNKLSNERVNEFISKFTENAENTKFDRDRERAAQDKECYLGCADVLREALAYREAESKPVAEIVSKHGDPEAFGERELQVIADIRKMPYGTKLYASPVLGQTSELRDIAIRVVGCISASGYSPKENSLNPLESLLFDAEKALEAK